MISFKNQCDFPSNRLDVRFTKVCDNACPFCVERGGIHTLSQLEIDKMVENTIKTNPDNVGILGGEPMLWPKKVYDYVSRVYDKVPEIYITTSLPISVEKEWDTWVTKAFDLLTGINVSIQAHNWEDHNKILHASSNHNRFTILQKIAKHYPDKLRVCINFYKGGIDTAEKLESLLELLVSWGVKSVKLNEIQWDESGYVSFAQMYNMKMKSAYAFGCYKELKEHHLNKKFPSLKIMLHRSCCWSQSAIEPTWFDGLKDIIKYLKYRLFGHKRFNVLYENGELSWGWRSEDT